jgi:hypothetical protein
MATPNKDDPPLIRLDFRYLQMVKCYIIVPFMRGHPSYKQGWYKKYYHNWRQIYNTETGEKLPDKGDLSAPSPDISP